MLRARFVQDADHPCHDQESADALEAVETVSYVAPEAVKKEEHRLARIRVELELARRKAKLATLEELAEKQPAQAAKVKLLAKRAAEKPAMAAVERRLTCEGLLGAQGKHQAGIYDDAMRLAVRRFQQKHMIYESNYLRKKTVDALAQPLLDNDYEGLMRAMRERVVSAAAILEDGSTSTPKNPMPDLVDDYTKTALEQLGLTNADGGAGVLQAPPAPRSSARCAPPSSCRRAPTTTRTTWTCRSSSIAATSGTTCRSTPRGTGSSSRASTTRT